MTLPFSNAVSIELRGYPNFHPISRRLSWTSRIPSESLVHSKKRAARGPFPRLNFPLAGNRRRRLLPQARGCVPRRHSTDIFVATPGRLVDHVRVTPHFSLADVRYLVLDESDRLLNDAYYSWIDVVVPACGRPPTPPRPPLAATTAGRAAASASAMACGAASALATALATDPAATAHCKA